METNFQEIPFVVIIPTYNNDKTLKAVVEDVLKYTKHILIVNDGSTDSTSNILNQYFSHLQVLHLPANQGKGFALRKGFKKALQLGYEYAITLDSDGQHFAEDIPKFLDCLKKEGPALIVGDRNMTQDGIPKKSSFGNNFSNFWFYFETGIKLQDTQSGYRLYPIKELEKLRFFTRKFEFEIEVMVKAAWAGIKVKNIPIKIYYAKEDRVSHFRPFKDFTRISLLNTYLVFITLIYIKPRNFLRKFRFMQDI